MRLKAHIKSFKVDSRADGTFIIRPDWKGPKWTPEDGGGPGLLTRLATAKIISKILNRRVEPVKPRDATDDANISDQREQPIADSRHVGRVRGHPALVGQAVALDHPQEDSAAVPSRMAGHVNVAHDQMTNNATSKTEA